MRSSRSCGPARVDGDFPLALGLRNAGFDDSITGGSGQRPVSWIDWTTHSSRFESLSSFNTPISAPFCASGSGSPSHEGEQIVDLYAEQLESWILDDRLTLRLKAYVSTIGDDFGRLMLRFYDEDMSLISTHQDTRFDTAADMDNNTWSEAVFFQPVPTNARFGGVVLHGDNNGGSNTAFCWDDVELQAHVLERFLAVGQFHTSFNATTVTINANTKHGAVHSAPNDLTVERLGFFANAALAARVKGLIYEVDGSNAPPDLVATSDQITSLRRGWNEVVFGSPPVLNAGQNYWIGFITDTAFAYRPGRHGDTPAASSSGSDTYADGPADPFGTASALGNNVPVYVIGSQAIPPALGDSGKGSIVVAISC
jgi:hypothetical protein